MRRPGLRAGYLFSLLVASLAVAPAAPAAAETVKFPAAGQLVSSSVAARSAPSATARTVRVLSQFRRDFRPQIVLAIAGRRVGSVAPTSATAMLGDADRTAALQLVARQAGAAGNALSVVVRDREADPANDELVVRAAGDVVEIFPFADGDVKGIAARVNANSRRLRATAFATTAALVRGEVVPLVGGTEGKPGDLWYKLNLPVRPFGTTGWVPAKSVSVKPTTHRIVVHRQARRLEVFHRARRIFRTSVAVGRPDRKTPLGNFYVAAKYRPAQNALVSAYALELSAPAGLPDFRGGGVVGIHGTPALWSIGKNVSNGCIRVVPRAALRLKKIVPLGTPVNIVR